MRRSKLFLVVDELALAFVAMVDQCIDLLDDGAELLLLRAQLVLQAVEAVHHIIKLAILCLVVLRHVSVEHAELVLELLLNLLFGSIWLVLLLFVDGDEV